MLFQIFKDTKPSKKRSMFGMPLHSIAAHFSMWYRLLPLRSINAEENERVFKDCKTSTNNTSNHHHDNVITNCLIRTQEKQKQEGETDFEKQDTKITLEYNKLRKRKRTIIPAATIRKDPAAYAAHCKRISDFLVTGTWHLVAEDGSVMFFDGIDEDRDHQVLPAKQYLR